MITLERNRLSFRFPEVHDDAACSIEFQRTLRIPDDDEEYPLPPGLAAFRCGIWTTMRRDCPRNGCAVAA